MNKIFLLAFFPLISFASADVAFLEMRTHDGKLIQLEKNGKFAHIALSYKGGWIHSHPYRGVELISTASLKKMGTMTIINWFEKKEPTKSEIDNVLGKPYDHNYSWNDDSYYCSELVAKMLGIKPEPMTFDSAIWATLPKKPIGQLGISPDEIYKKIKIN